MIPGDQLGSKLEEYVPDGTYVQDNHKQGHGPDDHIANLFCDGALDPESFEDEYTKAGEKTPEQIWQKFEENQVWKNVECFKCKVKGFKSENCYLRHLVRNKS